MTSCVLSGPGVSPWSVVEMGAVPVVNVSCTGVPADVGGISIAYNLNNGQDSVQLNVSSDTCVTGCSAPVSASFSVTVDPAAGNCPVYGSSVCGDNGSEILNWFPDPGPGQGGPAGLTNFTFYNFDGSGQSCSPTCGTVDSPYFAGALDPGGSAYTLAASAGSVAGPVVAVFVGALIGLLVLFMAVRWVRSLFRAS